MEYISRAVNVVHRTGANHGSSPGADGETASTTTEECHAFLANSPSLKALVRNPFVLRLFLEVLPTFSLEDRSKVTRYVIYSRFVARWFKRNLRRLPDVKREPLEEDEDEAVAHFEMISATLAGEMLKDNVLAIPLTHVAGERTASDSPVAWHRAMDAAYDLLVERKRYQLLQGSRSGRLTKRELAGVESEAHTFSEAHLEVLAALCPLRASGDVLQFIHKSFFEYFCARHVLLCAGADEDGTDPVHRTAEALAIPGRGIQAEPGVLQFLADHWPQGSGGSSARLRESLLGVVQRSVGTEPGSDSGAAANAATVLNWVGEPLSSLTWDSVVLDGADLSRANLAGTTARGASLRGCRLEHACLEGADVTDADMTGVDFGERAPVAVLHRITGLAWHPTLPERIFVAGPSGVRLWKADEGWPTEEFVKLEDGDKFVVCDKGPVVLSGGHRNRNVCIRNLVDTTSESTLVCTETEAWTVRKFLSDDGTLHVLSDDGTLLAYCTEWRYRVQATVVELSSRRKLATFDIDCRNEHSDSLMSLCNASSDSIGLVVGLPDGALHFLSVPTATRVATTRPRHGRASVMKPCVLDSGEHAVVIGTSTGCLEVWTLTGVRLSSLGRKGAEIRCIATTTVGGCLVATWDNDGVVRVWDERLSQVGPVWVNGKSPITALCFSALGEKLLLAIGSEDGALRIWSDPRRRRESSGRVETSSSGRASALHASHLAMRGCRGLTTHQLALLAYGGCEDACAGLRTGDGQVSGTQLHAV